MTSSLRARPCRSRALALWGTANKRYKGLRHLGKWHDCGREREISQRRLVVWLASGPTVSGLNICGAFQYERTRDQRGQQDPRARCVQCRQWGLWKVEGKGRSGVYNCKQKSHIRPATKHCEALCMFIHQSARRENKTPAFVPCRSLRLISPHPYLHIYGFSRPRQD